MAETTVAPGSARSKSLRQEGSQFGADRHYPDGMVGPMSD